MKNKTFVRSEISDIIIEQDGAQKELTENYDKAQAFNNYFSSVFTIESQNALPEVTNKGSVTDMKEITITADMVLKKLNCLNINKSAGPDGIHHRILQEGRNRCRSRGYKKGISIGEKKIRKQDRLDLFWSNSALCM